MTGSTPRGRLLPLAALVAGVAAAFAAATAISRRVFERPRRPAIAARPDAAAAGPGDALFRAVAIEGPVEVLHRGRWYPVQAGDRLVPDDVIRTPRGSRALLRRGATEIDIREKVDVRAAELAARTATFELVRGGDVSASVQEIGETLAIAARHTRSVNDGAARWVVQLGAEGQVSVAATAGAVRFAGAGREVRLPAGNESLAPAAGPPGEPAPIPAELFLSVTWPERRAREGQAPAQVTGQASPSTRVRVNGAPTGVGVDGRFRATVPLTIGANELSVEAEDITGRKKRATTVIRRAPPAPKLERADEGLWTR
jgi:hypothetical protein